MLMVLIIIVYKIECIDYCARKYMYLFIFPCYTYSWFIFYIGIIRGKHGFVVAGFSSSSKLDY